MIDFTIIGLLYNVYYYSLWFQTTYKIMEEDILKYSPTVMFRGTPCISRISNSIRVKRCTVNCKKIEMFSMKKVKKLRGHKVVPIMSHTFEFFLVWSAEIIKLSAFPNRLHAFKEEQKLRLKCGKTVFLDFNKNV